MRTPDSPDSPVDLVTELRLRSWARENHVSSDERQSTWHPIVLEEMGRRDAELADADAAAVIIPVDEEWAAGTRSVSAFVPLLPARYRRVDAAHPGVAAPNFVAAMTGARNRREDVVAE